VMPALAIGLAEAGGMGVRGLMLAILGASACSVAILLARLTFLTRKGHSE